MADYIYLAYAAFGNNFISFHTYFSEYSMKIHSEQLASPAAESTAGIHAWVLATLTSIFILLYAAALLGWLRPLPDDRMVARLEPIIFVFIGFCFGRLPMQQVGQTMRAELLRQTQKADAAQHAKEQALQVRETLEERIKNVQVLLASSASGAAENSSAARTEPAASFQQEALRQRVTTALSLLGS
jgi:hypothetical protein